MKQKGFLASFHSRSSVLANSGKCLANSCLMVADGLLFWFLVMHPDQPCFFSRAASKLEKDAKFPL